MRILTSLRSVLCALGAVLLLGGNISTASAQSPAYRAVWVDAWGNGFLNASQVTTLVNHCKTYNFNAVFVQMRRRGDAFYMPQSPNGDPRTTVIAGGYDALQTLITQCHAANPPIQVHCWITTNLIWSGATAPTQAGHVYNLHPEYLMETRAGATEIGEGYYLDPGHPGAAKWNHDMAMDIVNRYDIDGFHWDYVRYPQQDSGYNPTAVSRYNAEYGLTGKPLATDAQWSNWRRRQVTDFLRWTNTDILAAKPQMIISTAVFGSRSDAYNARFQDWADWNNEGIVDLCCPMNYSSSNSTFNSRVDDAYNNQGIRWVIMGQGSYLNTKENTVVQLNYAKNKPLNGTLFYSYRVPNSGTVDLAGTLAYVKANYQPTYVAPPALPWKASPTRGYLRGTVTRQDTGAVVYNATVTLNTPTAKSTKTQPHGKYGIFDTSTGSYPVTASAPGIGTATGTAVIVAGQVTTLNLVLSNADTTPPVISNVQSGSVSSSGAVITWTTNEASNSEVQYGLTTSYGSTASNGSMVLNHSVSLTGLAANTTYNFRVRSADSSSNMGTSGNFSFTTLAPGSVPDIVIDNPSATFTGAWTTASSATDKYGSDYRFVGQGSGTRYAEYRPNIVTAGNYKVYEWHCQGTNRTTAAPHVVSHAFGSTTVAKAQNTAGGQWNLVGTYYFSAGTSGYVRITDAFPDAGQIVITDAVKFVYDNATVADIIVDNPAATLTGTWTAGTASADKYGSNYVFANQGSGTINATFRPTVVKPGTYKVYEWHPQGTNRTAAAPHTISYSGGSTTIPVNQQTQGGQWNHIGTYLFNAGTSGYVRIDNNFPDAGKVVMADAIKLVYQP